MKYSKSESAYFRKSKKENTIKGGKLKENGKLENSDFINENCFVMKRNNSSYEFKTMKQTNVDTPPIKIMIQKKTNQPFLFFGYNPITCKYHLVCYINPTHSNLDNNLIKCNKLVIDENGLHKIVELSRREFLTIGTNELIVLCYNFLKLRVNNYEFMNELFEYLKLFVFGYNLLNTQNNTYRSMVEEINRMLINEDIYKEKKKNNMNKRQIKLVENWM